MMRISTLLGLAVLAALVGCASAPRTADGACSETSMEVKWRLQASGLAKSGYFKVKPEHVNVSKGCSFFIEFQEPVGAMTASTQAKQSANESWLGDGSPVANTQRIEIQVPDAESLVGNTYSFNVFLRGIGMLDPRVTVEQ